VPAVVKTDVFRDTLTELPVVPEPGFTTSHDPPELVAALAVKDRFGVPPIETACGAGAVVPI